MKFAVIALIATAGAIKLRSKDGGQLPDAGQIIASCDADGDSLLNQEEAIACIEKAKQSDVERWDKIAQFAKNSAWNHDANGDGKFNAEELQAAVTAFFNWQHKMAEALPKAEQALAYCDTDGDDALTKEEGLACLDAAAAQFPEQADKWAEIRADVESDYEKADKNGDGKLQKWELQHKIIKEGY